MSGVEVGVGRLSWWGSFTTEDTRLRISVLGSQSTLDISVDGRPSSVRVSPSLIYGVKPGSSHHHRYRDVQAPKDGLSRVNRSLPFPLDSDTPSLLKLRSKLFGRSQPPRPPLVSSFVSSTCTLTSCYLPWTPSGTSRLVLDGSQGSSRNTPVPLTGTEGSPRGGRPGGFLDDLPHRPTLT